MLQISKQGNSIVVEALNHFFYPYNGTLEVPVNSVITVVDEADIVLFRSASNYDVLFSAKVDEITINGQSVTKDNVGEVFGALSNVKSGGLTPEQEEKLNNAIQISDYNADKATQTTIDEAQNTEINKLKGDIEGKQDIIQDLNAIRQGADLGKTALQEETDPVWNAEKVNYYTKSEVDTSLESKANKSEIPTVPTNVSAFTNDAGYLTEHQSLDNYYTKTESDGIYATQVVVNEEIAARISDIREVKATLESKADKSEIPTVPTNVSAFTNDAGYLTEHQSLDNYYTKTEVNTSLESKANKNEIPTVPTKVSEFTNDAGYLTQHQTLKTINGETIVGNGNIEITSGEETDPVWTAEKGNYYTKTEVNSSLETKANKTEIPSLNGYATEQWVGEQGYLTEHQQLKTINGESILGSGDLVISGGGEETDPIWTSEKVNYYTKTEVNTSLETKADKTEIPIVPTKVSAFTNDAGYLTEHQSLDNYYTKTEVNDALETKANKSEIPSLNGYATEQWVGEQGYLTEHQTLKTINGESIIGNGDIVISGGGEETDPVWTAEKVNYYTKTEVNTSLESKANKTEIPIVPTKVSEFTNDAGYLTEHQTLKTINGETIVGNGNIEITSGEETDPVWTAEKVNYYTKSEVDTSLESKANKSEIPTVPTNVSAFTNDAGYLTEHQSLSNYYTKTEVDTSLETKADKTEIPSLDNYYTKSEIDGIVGNVNNALSEIING